MVKDESGNVYKRLTVIKRSDNYRDGTAMWKCKCICGKEIIVKGTNLRNGHTTSCGCYNKEKITKHGLSTSKTYKAWDGIKRRCRDKKSESYKNYGGRGIDIYNSWYDSFELFNSYIGEPPGKEYSVERINNDVGYYPGNIKWATREEQGNNKRNNVIISYKGKKYTLAQAARKFGIGYYTLRKRIKMGWPIEKSLKLVTKQRMCK